MNAQEFSSRHAHTLQTDPKTKQHYIKLPLTDLNELAYLQESLLDCILLLTLLEKQDYKPERLQSVIYWLSRLLKVSYPHAEIDGLSEWLTSKDKPSTPT